MTVAKNTNHIVLNGKYTILTIIRYRMARAMILYKSIQTVEQMLRLQ